MADFLGKPNLKEEIQRIVHHQWNGVAAGAAVSSSSAVWPSPAPLPSFNDVPTQKSSSAVPCTTPNRTPPSFATPTKLTTPKDQVEVPAAEATAHCSAHTVSGSLVRVPPPPPSFADYCQTAGGNQSPSQSACGSSLRSPAHRSPQFVTMTLVQAEAPIHVEVPADGAVLTPVQGSDQYSVRTAVLPPAQPTTATPCPSADGSSGPHNLDGEDMEE